MNEENLTHTMLPHTQNCHKEGSISPTQAYLKQENSFTDIPTSNILETAHKQILKGHIHTFHVQPKLLKLCVYTPNIFACDHTHTLYRPLPKRNKHILKLFLFSQTHKFRSLPIQTSSTSLNHLLRESIDIASLPNTILQSL